MKAALKILDSNTGELYKCCNYLGDTIPQQPNVAITIGGQKMIPIWINNIKPLLIYISIFANSIVGELPYTIKIEKGFYVVGNEWPDDHIQAVDWLLQQFVSIKDSYMFGLYHSLHNIEGFEDDNKTEVAELVVKAHANEILINIDKIIYWIIAGQKGLKNG